MVHGLSRRLFRYPVHAQEFQKKLKFSVDSERFEQIISFTAQFAEFIIFIWKLSLT